MSGSADLWDEVWDDYEARQMAREAVRHPAVLRSGAWRRCRLPLAVTIVFLLGCAAGSAWPVLNLHQLILQGDSVQMLRQVDLRGAEGAVRQAYRQQAGLTGAPVDAAGRLLAGMADEMAAAVVRPGVLAHLAGARQDAAPLPFRDAAAPALSPPALAARGGLSVDLGMAGQGGFGLDLAWREGGWRVVGFTVLDRAAPGAPPASHLAGEVPPPSRRPG